MKREDFFLSCFRGCSRVARTSSWMAQQKTIADELSKGNTRAGHLYFVTPSLPPPASNKRLLRQELLPPSKPSCM